MMCFVKQRAKIADTVGFIYLAAVFFITLDRSFRLATTAMLTNQPGQAFHQREVGFNGRLVIINRANIHLDHGLQKH